MSLISGIEMIDSIDPFVRSLSKLGMFASYGVHVGQPSIVDLLFGASEPGLIYDISDFSTMFQDYAGTTSVTAIAQPVGKILDISGNGNHAYQATSASRPILRQDGSGYYYLEFDGIDDFLETSAINFTSTYKMSVFSGSRKLNSGVEGAFVELSTNSSISVGAFTINCERASVVGKWNTYIRGNGNRSYSDFGGYVSPITNTLALQLDQTQPTADTQMVFNVNGSTVTGTSGSLDITDTVFGNHPIYIGRRGGTVLPFQGHVYSMIVRGALSTDDEVTATESYVNSKTGAY